MPSCRGQEKGGPRWRASSETRKDRGYHRTALLATPQARKGKKREEKSVTSSQPPQLHFRGTRAGPKYPQVALASLIHCRPGRGGVGSSIGCERKGIQCQGSNKVASGKQRGRLGQVRRVKWSRDAVEQCSAVAIAAPDMCEAPFRLPAAASMPRPHPPRLRRPAKSDLALDFRLEIRLRLLASSPLSWPGARRSRDGSHRQIHCWHARSTGRRMSLLLCK